VGLEARPVEKRKFSFGQIIIEASNLKLEIIRRSTPEGKFTGHKTKTGPRADVRRYRMNDDSGKEIFREGVRKCTERRIHVGFIWSGTLITLFNIMYCGDFLGNPIILFNIVFYGDYVE
jgi:hypothetical protein